MPRRKLEGKYCLVTGASSGIGYQLALQLAAHGSIVLATARREQKLLELSQAATPLQGEIHILAGDISERPFREQLIAEATSRFGHLDLLCNNAGIGSFGSGLEADFESTEKLFDVNVLAPIDLTRRAVSLLSKSDDPAVLYVGSVLGNFPVPLKSEYCATKFALRGWVEAIRHEAKLKGIEMILVSPSTTDSEFFENVLDDKTGLDWRRFGAMTPTAVANKIVAAIEKRKSRVTLTAGGKLASFAYGLMPGLVGKLLSRDAKTLSGPG